MSDHIIVEAQSDTAMSTPAWTIAAFPFIQENPYQRVLYAELTRHGFRLDPDADFRISWLFRERHRVSILHFHWPQNCYAWFRGPRVLRRALSWAKIGVFALRLSTARSLGYTIVWTIHEVYPHERAGGMLDDLGARLLARASEVLIAHDRGTALRVGSELGIRKRIDIIPHGSYIDVYVPGRPREVVRADFGIDEATTTFLCFGHLRGYKDVDVLLEAFRLANLTQGALVVAGVPLDAQTEEAVRRAADADSRIRMVLEFVPDDRVGELFKACDVAVLPRGDGGTSGALVLALSMGLPVVVADRPDYAELIGGDAAGWRFEPGVPGSLAHALHLAAVSSELRRTKGEAGRSIAERLAWPEIARRTARLLEVSSRSER